MKLRRLFAFGLTLATLLVLVATPAQASVDPIAAYWSPVITNPHNSACDQLVSYKETVRVTPSQNWVLQVNVPAGITSTSATMHYSLNDGPEQLLPGTLTFTTAAPAGPSASTMSGQRATFTMNGAFIPEGTWIDYAFEVVLSPQSATGSCLGSVSQIAPPNNAFHSIATTAAHPLPPYIQNLTKATGQLGNEPATAGDLTAECAAYFTAPTPCTELAGGSAPDHPTDYTNVFQERGWVLPPTNLNKACGTTDTRMYFYQEPWSTNSTNYGATLGSKAWVSRREVVDVNTFEHYPTVKIEARTNAAISGFAYLNDWTMDIGQAIYWSKPAGGPTGVYRDVVLTYNYAGQLKGAAVDHPAATGGTADMSVQITPLMYQLGSSTSLPVSGTTQTFTDAVPRTNQHIQTTFTKPGDAKVLDVTDGGTFKTVTLSHVWIPYDKYLAFMLRITLESSSDPNNAGYANSSSDFRELDEEGHSETVWYLNVNQAKFNC